MGRTVLVTGVAGPLGAKVAEALLTEPGCDRVIGVDSTTPSRPVGAMEFVRPELCEGSLESLIRDCGVDTVLHLSLAPAVHSETSGKRRRENHAVGTLQLLAACQQSPSVQRLVVRSSTSVYGATPMGNDADVERYVQGVARRRPEVSVAVLRLANLIGPSVESPLTRYFGKALAPRLKKNDPDLQFLHEDDAAEAISRMALSRRSGVFDVAAPGAMPLSQCLRRAGRPGLPLPDRGLRVLGRLVRRGSLGEYVRIRQMCCSTALDAGRLERALGWRPRYTALQAFDAYLAEYGRPRRRRRKRAAEDHRDLVRV